MKSASDILKSLGTETKKIIWRLAFHAFGIILLLILIDFIIGIFIFYNYVFLAERETPQVTESIIKFDINTYQKVLLELQAHEPSVVGTPTVGISIIQ